MSSADSLAASTAVLYGSGLFQDKYPNPTPSYAEQLAQLAQSRYTTIVLWALHVWPGGDFYYNDTPIVKNGTYLTSTDPKQGVNPELANLLETLKATSTVSKIIMSIGPFESDFDAILKSLPQAMINFQTLRQNLPIDGFDFDYEGSYSSSFERGIVTLTSELFKSGSIVTYCPYTYQSFWLQCLADAYRASNNVQPVSWFNLQCYDGGAGNDPADWARAIATYPQPLGIKDPNAFVVPGLWVANTTSKSFMGKCPNGIQQQFKQWSATGTRGGFLWNSSDIFYNETSTTLCPGQSIMPKDYAQAILNGVGATVPA